MKVPLGLAPEQAADRVVPATGPTAWLTSFTAAAMAFLAVFALALSMASGRLAERWSESIRNTATIRISAPADQIETQTAIVLAVLATTPGVSGARALTVDDQRALLEPWFGPDLPIDALTLPRLIEFTEVPPGYDAQGLRLRLQAEAPGAILDDHTRWRRPLAVAAERLRLLGWLSLGLIGAAMAAMITLAAHAALAANAQVIRVLRLVGATDRFIAGAFVRRFTSRATMGALVGTFAGMAGIFVLPSADAAGGFLTGLGFEGATWALPLALPPLAGAVAFVATRAAALGKLRELT
jgi:cell division transport system permease protein